MEQCINDDALHNLDLQSLLQPLVVNLQLVDILHLESKVLVHHPFHNLWYGDIVHVLVCLVHDLLEHYGHAVVVADSLARLAVWIPEPLLDL